MASQYMGFNRGADLSPGKIITNTVTGGTDIELRIDLTKNLTRMDVELTVEAIMQYLLDGSTKVLGV